MNKKTLSRIAALSIAAASAVSTLGITASAVVYLSFPQIYKLTETTTSGGTTTTTVTYYSDQAKANSANVGGAGVVSTATPSEVFSGKANWNFDWDAGNCIITANPTGGTYTYGNASGVATGSASMNSVTTVNRYATDYYWYSRDTRQYYPNYNAMLQAEPNIGSRYDSHPIAEAYRWSNSQCYFNYESGYYTSMESSSTIRVYGYSGSYTGSYSISSSYRTSSTTVYCYGGVYYPNYNNMVASLGFTPSSGTYSTKSLSSSESYSSSQPYFDPHYGVYRSYSSGYSDLVLINAGTGTYTVYYSNYTQKYYDTYSAASLATPGGYTVSTIPNSYYSASTLNTYGYNPYYYNGNYYNGYYYNGYYYNDPYSYYWNYNTTTTKDTSTVTIGKYKGWTNVIRYINASRSGASYDVNMKSETEIPSNVLKALKGKNVTLNLKFNSGAALSINGNDITSTDAISTDIKYVKNIPASLAKKAVKANSGVASAQFSISGGSLGASASVTIKFNTKRSGCDAKLYRYNASANSLSLVSNSSVKSSGNCTFDNVKQGGDYVIVLS